MLGCRKDQMIEKAGVIIKPFIVTGLNYKGLNKEQIHYYKCFFGKRSIDDINNFIKLYWS